MVDAEFAVQFLVLSQAASHPELIPNVGNIALLQRSLRRVWAKQPPAPIASCGGCSTRPA